MLKQSNNRKEQESKKLAADVEAFLAKGGKIKTDVVSAPEPRDRRLTVKPGWKNANDVFNGQDKGSSK